MHTPKPWFQQNGLTKTWVKTVLAPNNINPLVDEVMIQHLNDYLKFQPRVFCFSMGDNFSRSGNDITQGPIWVRPQSLVKDMIEEIICVVGHTSVKELTILDKENLMAENAFEILQKATNQLSNDF